MSGRRINVGYDMENPAHVGCSVFCEIVVNGVMAYFFYVYAWKNPDLAKHGDCWAGDGNDNGSLIDPPI